MNGRSQTGLVCISSPEDYENGIIWNVFTNRQLGYVGNTGYMAMGWKYEGKVYHYLNHRLIWETLNGPILDDLQLNHMDGNKLNNSVGNLERRKITNFSLYLSR